jgi:uncharacterized protein YbcI
MLVKSFYKENNGIQFRADLNQSPDGYSIDYFGNEGSKIKTEFYKDKSVQQLANIAESWVNNIQQLNG